MMRILNEEKIKELGLPDCFGTCLGGTECWDSCGDHGDTLYIKCLLQAKALVDSALEAEICGAYEIMENDPIYQSSPTTAREE